MALEKLEARFPSTAFSFTLEETTPNTAAATVSIAAAERYLTTSNGATASLLSALQTALNAFSANTTYTVTLDDTADSATGKVTIAMTGCVQSNITFDTGATALFNYLGFTTGGSGSVGFGASATGSYQARFLYLPNVGRTNRMGSNPTSTSYELGVPETDYIATMAPGGQVKRTVYSTRYKENLEFELVVGTKALTRLSDVSGTVNASFERFYRDCVGNASPFRYHPDRSDDAVYFSMQFMDGAEFRCRPEFRWDGASSLWHIGPYEIRKLV